MIIQANQAFEVIDRKLGVLSLKYGEIRANVDEGWNNNDFFKALVADGLIAYYSDSKDATAEKAQKEAKAKSEKAEEDTELNRLIDEARAKAKSEAEQVIATHGYNKNKGDRILKQYTEDAIKAVKEKYAAEKAKSSEANDNK